MTHDYARNGTPSLLAALDAASGPVIARYCRRHRHREFPRFLKLIDNAVPGGLDLHLTRGDYATHKAPAVGRRLLRHPVPPALRASWTNVAERWFAELTNRKLGRSAHRDDAELKPASVTGSSNGTGTRNRSRGPGPPMRYPGTSPCCRRVNDPAR
jgi:hypothetical protein